MPADRSAGTYAGAMPAQPNMQQLMKQAQQMQQDLLAAQAELASKQVEGSAGGGLVRAVMSGSGELVSLTIDPKAVDPDDIETDLARVLPNADWLWWSPFSALPKRNSKPSSYHCYCSFTPRHSHKQCGKDQSCS